MFSITKKYARNLFWQVSGSALAQIINIVTMPIITRLYSPTDLGALGLFMQYLGLFAILISFRFEQLIVLPAKDDDAQKLAKLVLKMGLLTCILWTIICAMLLNFTAIPKYYYPWVMSLPLAAFLIVGAQALQQLDQRGGNFKFSGLSEFVNRSVNSIVALLGGLLSLGGLWLWIAVLAGQLGKALMFHRHFHITSGSFMEDVRDGVMRAKSLGFLRLNGSLISSHAMLAVTAIVPLSFVAIHWSGADAGYLSLVMSTLALPTALMGNAVGQVFYQQASQQFAKGQSFFGLLISNAKLLLLLGSGGFLLVFLFGPQLYTIVFGDSWTQAGVIASYFSVAAALSFLTTPFDRAGIIVNAWWYGPSWHFARVSTTIVIVGVAWLLDMEFEAFIFLYVLQLSVMYVIDAIASLCFARRTRPFGATKKN